MRKSIVFGLAVLTISCGASLSQIVTDIIDVADAVCVAVEKQPDPAWVYYLCTVAGAPPGVASQYTMRVPAADAAGFAAAHSAKPKTTVTVTVDAGAK
jgi:hypothetical protein